MLDDKRIQITACNQETLWKKRISGYQRAFSIISITVALCICIILVSHVSADARSMNYRGLTLGDSVAAASDGSLVITGSTDPTDKALYYVYLAKISTGGETIWKKTYEEQGDSVGQSVRQTLDGGYIVAGTRNTLKAGDRIFLLKTDANGTMQWCKTYGRTGGDTGNDVLQTSDGGYIIAGKANSFTNRTNDEIYLVRTDANGSVIWDRTYEGAIQGYGVSVAQACDGGFVICGPCNGSASVCLIKTDAGGNVAWSKAYGKTYSDFGYSAIMAGDGSYLIVGQTRSSDPAQSGMYLIKTDYEGNAIWDRTYGGYDGIAIVQTNEGGYLLGGTADGSDNGLDFYVVKTDAEGSQLWNKTYGGNHSEFLGEIVQSKDGSYVAIGDYLDSNLLKTSACLIKMDSGGNVVWNKTFSESDFKNTGFTIGPISQKTRADLMMIGHISVLTILAVIGTAVVLLKRRKER